jgi:hypothetical protein
VTNIRSFDEFGGLLRSFIRSHAPTSCRSRGGCSARAADEFSQLALALFKLQFDHVPAYRALCMARGATPAGISHWKDVPAVPTRAFKEFEFTSLASRDRITVFHSSGTTESKPSRHFHDAASLQLYEAALLAWFQTHGLPETLGQRGGDGPIEPAGSACSLVRPPLDLEWLFLTPPAHLAPRSSLVWMFDAVRRLFGASPGAFAGVLEADGGWGLDVDLAIELLETSTGQSRPVFVLGTAFSFVHLLDALAERGLSFRLPAGSRALETGGYKGRTRAVPKPKLRGLMATVLGIPPCAIIGEYGMSELSSQAYDRIVEVEPASAATAGSRTSAGGPFRFPPWTRSRVISPESGDEVGEGATGLLRVYDLANVRSVLAVQTEDLATRRGDGFELLGRSARAEARGCSLMSV